MNRPTGLSSTSTQIKQQILAGVLAGLGLTAITSNHAHAAGGIDAEYNRGIVLKGTITKISDGDTVHFVPDAPLRARGFFNAFLSGDNGELDPSTSARLTVRMVGMDTPELHLPYPGGMGSQGYWAEEAQRVLAGLIPVGTRVELETYGTDVHGRTLGRVIADGHDVHEDLIQDGLAVTYQICSGSSCNQEFYSSSKFYRYRELCQEAVDGQTGIYSPVNGLPELPFEYRLRLQNRTPDKWVGNAATKELFSPQDYNKVPICDRLFFPVRSEAEAMGYSQRPDKRRGN